MKRRAFLQALGAGVLAPRLVARVLAGSGVAARHHWTWLNLPAAETPDEHRRRFAEIRAAGIGSVLLRGADAVACRLAAAEGLAVHAWTWTLCRGGDDLPTRHPDWYVVSRDGRSAADDPPYVPYYRFLCPSRPEVRAHLREVFAAAAAVDGLAGVHLDYVRYPDVILPRALWEKYGLVQDRELPRYDFCYCDVCCEGFRRTAGRDPRATSDPSADPDWRRFRWDAVSRVVADLVEVIHAAGRQATAAVFPSPTIARRLVRQDWADWPLDAVLPMVYHNFYDQGPDWIEPTVREAVAALPAARPLYAGLYLPALTAPADFERAVAGAIAGGARGVALFGGVRPLPAREGR